MFKGLARCNTVASVITRAEIWVERRARRVGGNGSWTLVTNSAYLENCWAFSLRWQQYHFEKRMLPHAWPRAYMFETLLHAAIDIFPHSFKRFRAPFVHTVKVAANMD